MSIFLMTASVHRRCEQLLSWPQGVLPSATGVAGPFAPRALCCSQAPAPGGERVAQVRGQLDSRRQALTMCTATCSPNALHFGLVTTGANPTAPVPNGAQLSQFLFGKESVGGERVQMIGAVDHASTTAQISLDGFVAPNGFWRNLTFGSNHE